MGMSLGTLFGYNVSMSTYDLLMDNVVNGLDLLVVGFGINIKKVEM